MKKTDYDAKITEIEGKILHVSNLVTKTALTTAENKISDVGNLVKKTNSNTKITEIENKLNNHKHDKYITTAEFNTLAADVFNARLAQVHLVTETFFDNTASSLDSKTELNQSLGTTLEKIFKKLRSPDLSYFRGKSYFEEDGVQDYLIFQPIFSYFKVNTIVYVTNYILSWKSKGLSGETIKPPTTSDNSLTPATNYYNNTAKIRVKFAGNCLKQSNKLTYTHRTTVNIYIVYELGAYSSNNSDPTLKSCLFGTVTLTKNTDIDKYGYSGYGIGI